MGSHATTDRTALKTEAELFGIPYYDAIPFDCLEAGRELPAAWARMQCLFAARMGDADILFMPSAGDIELLERASRVASCRFEPAVAPREAILEAIARTASGSVPEARPEPKTAAPTPDDSETPQAREASPQDASRGADASSSATSYIDDLLAKALREGASDIHVEPFAGGFSVRFRIDGLLHARTPPPRGIESAVVSRIKVMAGMDISERRLPQDGMAEADAGGRTIDIRVSTVPVAYGERIVMRLLNRDDAFLPLGSLGMEAGMLQGFRKMLARPNGIIAISGPTGSGKTTTLYAALGEIDSSRRNILTIEDPVEYRMPGVGQIQVKPKIGLTFASGLRHILRQDPDVILVGETRDRETAEIAVRASLTGHLVLTTLHTNDAPSAVVRLVDMGVEPYLVAASLRGVLSQRLVRRLCPRCRRRVADGGAAPFEACGCPACTEGYKGRVGVFEMMLCNEAVAELIRGGTCGTDALRLAAADGYFPMADDALAKMDAGVTDFFEIAGVLAE